MSRSKGDFRCRAPRLPWAEHQRCERDTECCSARFDKRILFERLPVLGSVGDADGVVCKERRRLAYGDLCCRLRLSVPQSSAQGCVLLFEALETFSSFPSKPSGCRLNGGKRFGAS